MPSMEELMSDPALRDLYVYSHLQLTFANQGIVPANLPQVIIDDERSSSWGGSWDSVRRRINLLEVIGVSMLGFEVLL